MAKAAIKRGVALFRTGIQTPGSIGWPMTFNKQRLERWVENTNASDVHPAINFGVHVKSKAAMPVRDVEELYMVDEKTKAVSPICGQAENWRIEDDKVHPGRHLLFADIRARDKTMVQAIGKNFPLPSITVRRGQDGKERITSVTFLGKASPPAVEGLPPPPSTVVEAAAFQRHIDSESGGDDSAYTVVLEAPEELETQEFNKQEGPEMGTENTDAASNLKVQLAESSALVVEAKAAAAENKETLLAFSQETSELKELIEKQQADNKALSAQLSESKVERVKAEAMMFAEAQVKEMTDKSGLSNAHAERIKAIVFAMRTGEDTMTFSGDTDAKPMADQVAYAFSKLIADGAKAYVPATDMIAAGIDANTGDVPAPGKKPETPEEEMVEFSRISAGMDDSDQAAIAQALEKGHITFEHATQFIADAKARGEAH